MQRTLIFAATAISMLCSCAVEPLPSATKPIGGASGISAGVEGTTLNHVGDVLSIGLPSDQPSRVVLVNLAATDKTRTLILPAGAQSLKLDADTLPGFDADAPVQSFSLKVEEVPQGTEMPRFGSQRTLDVVTDPKVVNFPSVPYQLGGANPPGKSEWVASKDAAGADELAARFEQAVAAQDMSLSNSLIALDRIVIPAHMGGIPPNMPLREYTLKGKFQTYLVPKETSGTGRAEVITPSAIRFVISQSEPAQLIRFDLMP